MPPTVTEDAPPSAPPLEGVPVVQAAPMVASSCPPMAPTASAVATAVPHASMNASMPPKTAVPAGMVAQSTTTTYPDGRQVTVTEFVPANGGAAPAAAPAASGTQSQQYHPPRRDLGSRPVNITCPYCKMQSVRTRINHNCGDCTLVSVIILLLFCLPFFWIPFICPSCQDVEHHCSNCGRLVGKSRAECCS